MSHLQVYTVHMYYQALNNTSPFYIGLTVYDAVGGPVLLRLTTLLRDRNYCTESTVLITDTTCLFQGTADADAVYKMHRRF